MSIEIELLSNLRALSNAFSLPENAGASQKLKLEAASLLLVLGEVLQGRTEQLASIRESATAVCQSRAALVNLRQVLEGLEPARDTDLLLNRAFTCAYAISQQAQSAPPRPARVFIDMDGVLADFDRYCREHNVTPAELKVQPGAYLALEPMPGALVAVRQLIAAGFDVWIATKPPTGVAHAYSEKAEWIYRHLPELSAKIIISHNKGLLGGEGDFLVDDRPHKADCDKFRGVLLHFGHNGLGWEQVTALLLSAQPRRQVSKEEAASA